MKFREAIVAIYREHNLAKLADIEILWQKYRGCEQNLYTNICSKYGVDPAQKE